MRPSPYAIADGRMDVKEAAEALYAAQTAKLEAHDAGNDAEYLWKGPFIETINDKIASLSGLSAGKYIYVLRVMKQGCASVNISTVDVQKDEAKASIKN